MAEEEWCGDGSVDAGHLELNRGFFHFSKEDVTVTGIRAQEILNDLESSLKQFRLIANDLGSDSSEKVT